MINLKPVHWHWTIAIVTCFMIGMAIGFSAVYIIKEFGSY